MLREFNRDVYGTMQDWKESCKSYKVALVVNGARQVGKTYSIKRFTKNNFDKVYYADLFEEDFRERAKFVIGKFFNTQQIVETLFPNFQDGKDNLIVFDEIQEFSHIYNLIRPINRGMNCQLIVSGSFLGRVLDKGFRTSAGDTTHIKMYGMSFPEFLGAFGVRDLYDKTDLFGGSNPSVYEQLRQFFILYCRIGGYPKVVERFISTQNFSIVDGIFEQLVYSICEETGRYFGEIQDSAKLSRLLRGVATLLVKEKRGGFKFSSELGRTVENTDKRSIINTLHWFWKSGVLEPCGKVNDCDPNSITPESLFYFSDLGIGNYLYNKVLVQTTNIYGAICENFAYSCIRDMRGIMPEEPSFATYGMGELDYLFFVRSSGNVVPIGIEVKGGKSVGNTASELLKNEKISYLINAKVDTQGGRHENIFTLPLPLLGKFNIFDYIPDDSVISPEEFKDLFTDTLDTTTFEKRNK